MFKSKVRKLGQEPSDQIETSPSAMADKLTVRPTPETPEQAASEQILIAFHLPVLRF
jgi:hypothetical protein